MKIIEVLAAGMVMLLLLSAVSVPLARILSLRKDTAAIRKKLYEERQSIIDAELTALGMELQKMDRQPEDTGLKFYWEDIFGKEDFS